MPKHITSKECTVERSPIDGAMSVSAIVGGHLRRIRYYGYTKRQAVKAFIVETAPENNK